MNIAEKLAELGPKVAAFVSRGRKPRDLTQDERRLSVSDPQAFDALVQSLQAQTLADIRDEAAFGVLQEDLAAAQAAERAQRAAEIVAQREELLALRHEASLEVDAALADADASLRGFQELSAKIAGIDRALGDADRNRASYGLMTLGLKRSIRDHAPALWKLMGGKMTGQGSNNGLSEMSKPAGYDLASRHGAEPF